MPTFPNTEVEILSLAQSMVNGYGLHEEDFPGVDPATLTAALNNCIIAKNTQDQAKGGAVVATETKNEKLIALTRMMKDDLKVSEADVSGDPEKLSYIGWGPKASPTPIVAPGSPTDLRPVYDGVPGEVTLEWKKPADGGPVRNYIVQRRDQAASGQFGAWQMLDFAYDTTVSFTGQPAGVRMEYRVTAANAAGESAPSNTIAVVL